MKSRYLLISILVPAIFAMILTSCNSGEYKGFKKTGSGIYYKIETAGNKDTTRITVGKIVTMDMRYRLEDTILYDSRSRPAETRLPIQESVFEGDFYEGIQLFNQGDSGTFIIKAGPFFTQTIGQPAVPEFCSEDEDIFFDVYIKKVMTQQEVEVEEAAMAEQMKQMEGGTIEKFIEEKGITVSPDENGIYYIEIERGKGKFPQVDEYATVHFTVSLLDGQHLFSSADAGQPLEFQIGSRFENDGFQKVVQRMKLGGKAEAIVPSELAFGAQGMRNIVPPYSPLFYEVELIGIMSKEEYDKKILEKEAQQKAEEAMKEKQEMIDLQNYLEENNITVAPRESGLVYIETQAGSGDQPEAGQKVKVHYTGTLLDGTKFDSSLDRGEPLEFTIGQGQVIKGWDEGIALMKEGGKATLIIPSSIGYGARGAGGIIQPYSTLVFDVELIEVVK
jgi:peptidylprolyl isomerase